MRIVQADKLVRVDTGFFIPYNRYVVSDFECDQLIEATPNTHWRWSSFNALERRYGGQDLSGKKVCVYRHTAWGDQLIVSAVPAELKRRYPDATIHLFCHRDVMSLWAGNPYVNGTAIPLPINLDATRFYDYVIFYEGILESNREVDQKNCYDDMFEMIGLTDVPDHAKRPSIFPLPEDYSNVEKIKFNVRRPYILYHMSPANLNRRYPPDLSRKLLWLLAKKYRDHAICVVGVDEKHEYDGALSRLPSNCENWLSKTGSFRNMLPIVENAKALVCPDSSLMHLAACYPTVPVVSLWGLFDPQDRIKYYPNSYPITGFEACPHAPCRDHNFFLPTEQCKDAKGAVKERADIKHCLALTGITPERIVETVEKAICALSTGAQAKP